MAKKTETTRPAKGGAAAQAAASRTAMGRRQQFIETYRVTKRTDPAIGRWIAGLFVVGFLVFFALMRLLSGGSVIGWILAVVAGLLGGSVAAMFIFSRRAQRSAYAQMEGQPGAAAAALGMLRRGWKTDPAVAFTRQQDVVHRVVGPPGIVLVGEGGSPARVRQLLTAERRKHERVLADTPVHEVVCGNGEGEVPLPKILRHVQKLGRQVKPAEQTDILARLRALDANRSNVPLPKGPVPTSMKGLRQNMRGR